MDLERQEDALAAAVPPLASKRTALCRNLAYHSYLVSVPLALPRLDRLVVALSARPEILEAYLFGSHARGEASLHSDIDIAVFVEASKLDAPGFGYEAELGAELQKVLARSDVDLLLLNHAPPLLYHRVLKHGQRLLARDLAATTTREGQALSRYCDYVPQLRKIEAAHRLRLDSGGFGR